ncbi:MAG: hypothetical protein HPAVJP_5670 [Candidatus Hepatoplasma vulgare]|nr:MAG: hypothetical protein HPAVJP_5670 [Candidatus Hepatoplasma sp.]
MKKEKKILYFLIALSIIFTLVILGLLGGTLANNNSYAYDEFNKWMMCRNAMFAFTALASLSIIALIIFIIFKNTNQENKLKIEKKEINKNDNLNEINDKNITKNVNNFKKEIKNGKKTYKKGLLCLLFFGLFLILIPIMINTKNTINDLKDDLRYLSDVELLVLKNQRILLVSLIFIDAFFALMSFKYFYNSLINLNILGKNLEIEEKKKRERNLEEEEINFIN